LLIIGVPDSGGPGLALPIAATAVVAVFFEPIRVRMQRWANRLVYGNRATPHEVLSQLTSRLADTARDGGTNDLARLLAEGTGADQAIVWIGGGETVYPVGTWPADGSASVGPIERVDLVDDETRTSRPVRHEADLLGAVSVSKPRNDPVTPADRELVEDVAAGAGLVLRNITLNRQLEQRAREVRQSRRRLIAAQDAEAHRLERDLHDGAQQQVVALKVKLGLAKAIAQKEGADDIATLVDRLAVSTQDAVDAMRAVAHGIYPPLLEAEGLEVALKALARPSAGRLTVVAARLGRFDPEVEATAYFCVREAAHGAHMAGARDTHIDLTSADDELVIEIGHDAPSSNGEVTVVSDRVEAFGGNVAIAHPSPSKTLMTCRLPTAEHALEPA
jgi:signal transduction histidine kinase